VSAMAITKLANYRGYWPITTLYSVLAWRDLDWIYVLFCLYLDRIAKLSVRATVLTILEADLYFYVVNHCDPTFDDRVKTYKGGILKPAGRVNYA
jgi:hypothetical protein